MGICAPLTSRQHRAELHFGYFGYCDLHPNRLGSPMLISAMAMQFAPVNLAGLFRDAHKQYQQGGIE